MTVTEVEFRGYRNIKDCIFTPSPGVNVLYGSNGQGKTNILEAVWLFTGERSFRGAKDQDLIRFGEKAAQLRAFYDSRSGRRDIRLILDGGRSASLGGVKLDSPLRLSGEYCAVIFSPEHLALIKDGPQPRRRFIDAAICQVVPRHIAAVTEYRRVLIQRNSLLKDIPFHSSLMDTLGIWDERLCRAGAAVVYTRMRYLRRLAAAASERYAGIAGEKESFALRYIDCGGSEYPQKDGAPDTALIYDALCRRVSEYRARDIETGYSHAGPHRDDLEVSIAGISAREFGSQGQQRTAALALKLAEAAVIKDSVGEPPVLLLDDVMSELDRSRQEYLVKNIEGMQVFITCCDPSAALEPAHGRLFGIKDGEIAPDGGAAG
jgi:DNA replication and repair protein RecF